MNNYNQLDWKPLNCYQTSCLQSMSLDSLVGSYKNGFRLDNDNNNNNKILRLGTSTCPSGGQLSVGDTRTISISPLGGTPPYTLNWKVDGTISNTWANISSGQNQTFDWSFNEPIGTHVYTAEVIDSCSKSDLSSCTINVTTATTQPPTTQPPTTQPPTTQPPTTQPPTTPPPIIPECQGCDLTNNYCFMNQCIPKKYTIYGGLGLVLLLLLMG